MSTEPVTDKTLMTLDDPRIDAVGVFHFYTRQSAHRMVAPCGTPKTSTTRRPWFRLGDRRGGAPYVRACDTCSEWLTF